uniref:Galactosylgalactosylxylosylprotein 3-beta-glucuronosyltransferase n=1 Tax=Rhabditophanes sp. KR3021 TaxID=114890 RepID=A0AC35TJL2_9BILA
MVRRKHNTLIIIVTPTYKRRQRLADMTRLSQTLGHLKDIYWLVIEDGPKLSRHVQQLLKRSKLPHEYVSLETPEGYPKSAWYQRDIAVQYLARESEPIMKGYKHAVVYFADDDNAYDLRLFNNYIRKVKKFGVWAAAFLGFSSLEYPMVKKGKLVGFSVCSWTVNYFALDMAMFAFSMDLVKAHPKFAVGKTCHGEVVSPEACIIEQLNIKMKDVEVFGNDLNENGEKEVLVYHVRTETPYIKHHGTNCKGYSTEYTF